MPFDGSENGSPVLQRLVRAYERIQTSWIKNTLVKRTQNGRLYFCAVGAISCDDKGVEEQTREVEQACAVVRKIVAKHLTKLADISGNQCIVSFNDAHSTTQAHMARVMLEAVEYQQELEGIRVK